ncbi:GIP, partial [Symbiodinium necroappetens]
LTKAYWFLEKAGLSADLRKQVVSAAGGDYDYIKLRRALVATVPKVKREEGTTTTPRPSFRQWKTKNGGPKQVHATTEEDDDTGPQDEDHAEEADPEELESELEVLLTQAARKRAEVEKARGFAKGESSQARESRIREMKSRMPCSACKAHGKTVFGQWHSDAECPYNSKKGGQERSKVLAVVSEELSDSEDDELVLPASVYLATSEGPDIQDEEQAPSQEVWASAVAHSMTEPDKDTLALSDTCCARAARTVAGKRWIERHIRLLRGRGEDIFIVNEARPFRFGGGPRILSEYAALIPVQLDGAKRSATLRISVVDQEIPLLLSKAVLKQLGMVMDLDKGVIDFREMQTQVPLRETRAGLCGFQINTKPSRTRLECPPDEFQDGERDISHLGWCCRSADPSATDASMTVQDTRTISMTFGSFTGGQLWMANESEEFVVASASRCRVSAADLRAHTLDRLKELWMAVRPPRKSAILPPNWKKMDVQGLRELYSNQVVEDLGRDQDHHWARWSRSQLIMEIEMWAVGAAEAAQMDRDLEMCHIPMLQRVNRLRRFPACKSTLPYNYDGKPVKIVQDELEMNKKAEAMVKEKAFLPRAQPKQKKSMDRKVNANLTVEESVMIQHMRMQKQAQAKKVGKEGNLPVKVDDEPFELGSVRVMLVGLIEEGSGKEAAWECSGTWWCKWAGPPMRVATDLEGGFVGREFWTKARKIERHNQTIKDMLFATIRQASPAGRDEMRKLSREVAWAKNSLVREHGWAPVALVFGREPRVFGEMYHAGNPTAYHPSVGDADSDVAVRMRFRYHAKMEFVRSQARQMLLRTAHNRTRKLPIPKIGQLVFFWRAGKEKNGDSQSRWLGPGYVVGLQDRNAWVAIGGRCFLVAGEHLREAVGDEKHFGNPEIQKAIALFKKVPREATYENLVGQEDAGGEPLDVETQPLNRDVADELMMDESDLDTEGLSREHADMCQQIGWHVDGSGNPVLVSHRAWAFGRQSLGIQDQHQFIPHGPVAGLITIFQNRTIEEAARVHATQQPTESKTKRKRMLEKEIPYHSIPPQDKQLYEEAEQKEWQSWLDYNICEILSPEESQAIEQQRPDRILPSRYVFRNKNAGLLDADGKELPVKARLCLQGHLCPDSRTGQVQVDSPTVERVSTMVFLHLVTSLGWTKDWFIGDISNAFLQGAPLTDKPDMFMRQPKQVKVVVKENETCVTLAQNAFIDARLQPMKIEPARMKQLDARANQAETTDYRSIVGSLQWLAVQSRPDIAFECNQLQKRVSDLRIMDLVRANKAVREVVRNRTEILFKPLGYDAELVTYHDAGLYSSVGAELDEQQCDDILQSSLDKKLVYSQKGAVVAFVKKGDVEKQGRVHINVIDWRSATNRRIVESSFAAETHAAIMGHNMSRFAQVLMCEIKFGAKIMSSVEDDGWQQLVPLTLVTDCKSIYDTIHKDGQHVGEKGNIVHAILLRQLLTTRNQSEHP